jgi:hypothetical protein
MGFCAAIQRHFRTVTAATMPLARLGRLMTRLLLLLRLRLPPSCFQDVEQEVTKPGGSQHAAYSRVAPLDDDEMDPWADARKHLASQSADVSLEGVQGCLWAVCCAERVRLMINWTYD